VIELMVNPDADNSTHFQTQNQPQSNISSAQRSQFITQPNESQIDKQEEFSSANKTRITTQPDSSFQQILLQ